MKLVILLCRNLVKGGYRNMAMIKCPECGKEISETAESCPNCGYKLQKQSSWSGETTSTGTYSAIEQPSKKKKKSKGLIWVIVVIVALIVIANSGDKEKEEPADSQNTVAEQENQEDSKEKEDAGEKEQEKITVKKQKVYNDKNVVIWVDGYDDNGHKLNIRINNNSKLNLGFNAHAYAVNGIMTGNNIYDMDCDVAKGKKANTDLRIDDSFLQEHEISEVKYIDVLFWAYDNDNYIKEFDTGQIRIKTSAYDKKQKWVSGETVYKQKNIQIDYLNNSDNKYNFSINNETGTYFDFDIENVSINDYTKDTDWDFDLSDIMVLKDCQAQFTIELSNDFLSKNNIKKVKKIEFSLGIRPEEDYFKEYNSKVIKLKVK